MLCHFGVDLADRNLRMCYDCGSLMMILRHLLMNYMFFAVYWRQHDVWNYFSKDVYLGVGPIHQIVIELSKTYWKVSRSAKKCCAYSRERKAKQSQISSLGHLQLPSNLQNVTFLRASFYARKIQKKRDACSRKPPDETSSLNLMNPIEFINEVYLKCYHLLIRSKGIGQATVCLQILFSKYDIGYQRWVNALYQPMLKIMW